jgi:hypothetical protein
MHSDADGQQLDKVALGIILVIQGELPSLVVVTVFGRLRLGLVLRNIDTPRSARRRRSKL